MDDPKALWEILVPTVRNNGRYFHTRYHRVWDGKVREIAGGLTIMPVARGQWVHQQEIFAERMIPVRIYATRAEMDVIVEMTAVYYNQIAVLAYKVSSDVIMRLFSNVPSD